MGGKGTNISGKQLKATQFRGFVAGLIKRLQAEADTEKRHATGEGFEEGSSQAAFVERPHQGGIVTNAGKEQSVRLVDALRSLRADRLRSEALEGALDGGGIAGAVVDERDSHRRPLVLGRTLRRRLSRETAKRRARAKALNSASI